MRPGSGDARLPAPALALGSYALYHFGTSGAAVATATAVTHPLGQLPALPLISNVIKVRLQMQLAGQRGNLVGMLGDNIYTTGRKGRASITLPGTCTSIGEICCLWGLRLGLYEPCKHVCSYAPGSTNFAFKFASGVIAGALETALTNPMEVLKVRLQMSPSSTSTIGEMRKVLAQEGLKALWKGVGPAMARAGCLTASQMATYDEAKQALMKWTPLEEGFQLHLICIAGTAGTLVTAPVDMIKTRLMLQRESKGSRVYRNGFHCVYQVVVTEGVKSLYKGGFATFARLGPQTTITFIVCEKLRELVGMTAI